MGFLSSSGSFRVTPSKTEVVKKAFKHDKAQEKRVQPDDDDDFFALENGMPLEGMPLEEGMSTAKPDSTLLNKESAQTHTINEPPKEGQGVVSEFVNDALDSVNFMLRIMYY